MQLKRFVPTQWDYVLEIKELLRRFDRCESMGSVAPRRKRVLEKIV